MEIWYQLLSFLPFEWAQPGTMLFMKNALLGILVLCPLLGLLSCHVVTGNMSFFSDALGHSAFTGIAIGSICGMAFPLGMAVALSVVFALLFTYVRRKSNLSGDTVIGVFSSTAVALGILIATWGGGSFTKFNNYLIGDILSVRPAEIGILAIVLILVVVVWCICSNGLFLSVLHPNLAHSRGVKVGAVQALFTVVIAVVVTMALSWVGLLVINSLLVLPGAAARNFAKNLRQYHLLSVLGALICGILGLMASYYWGCSTGAAVSLLLAVYFFAGFLLRRGR
ncbi:MAG: metal ABC transporter permease [Oscillospiraceae bacterium]|nr:metal ABC transporter permease [Oscillospiraceae bacterium]